MMEGDLIQLIAMTTTSYSKFRSLNPLTLHRTDRHHHQPRQQQRQHHHVLRPFPHQLRRQVTSAEHHSRLPTARQIVVSQTGLWSDACVSVCCPSRYFTSSSQSSVSASTSSASSTAHRTPESVTEYGFPSW